MNRSPCLKRPLLWAGMQLEVLNADGGDDVAFTPRVTGAVGEYDLVVALAAPQQTEVLKENEPRGLIAQVILQDL